MANGSIVVNNSNIYTIDILNGEGQVYHQLKFNLDDVNLAGKVIDFYNRAQTLIKEITEKQEKIEAKLKSAGVEDITQVSDDKIDSAFDDYKEYYDVQIYGFEELRNIIDELLGLGTCQKIFGDTNSYTLFDSFINGLVPEFEKMGVKVQNMKKQLYNKYNKDNGKVLR